MEPLSDTGFGTLSIEALSSTNGGGYLSAVIVVIVVLLVGLALWSMLSQAFGGSGGLTPKARNLFLGVRVTPIAGPALAKASAGELVAHVLSLDLRTATLVSPRFFAKGDRVRLDLGTHPDYPDNPLTLEANVVSYRTMGGDPESFLVKVRFLPTAAAPQRELARYVEALGHHAGLSHA